MQKFSIIVIIWLVIFFVALVLTGSKAVAALVMLALGIAVVPLAERVIAFWVGFTSRRSGRRRG